MGWSQNHGKSAKVNAEYAKVQGDVAKQEASNLAKLKTDAEAATQNANKATANTNAVIEDANTAASNADNAASEAIAQANHAKNEGDRAKAEADRLAGTDVSVLDNKIGSLSSLNTTNKTSVVASVNEVTTQLAQTARQTSVLSQGMSVVSANNTALADVEIEGRTLVNLLGRLGRTATSATLTVESTKYYVFVKHNQTTKAVAFEKFTGQTTLSLTWATGEYAALYEVESTIYTKIGVEWDSAAVGLRYPYVDDVKHLQGVGVVAEGENLLPPFTEYSIPSYAIEPYTFKYDLAPTGTLSSVVVLLGKSQQYRLEVTAKDATLQIRKKDANGPAIASLTFDVETTKTLTFTTSPDEGNFALVINRTSSVNNNVLVKNPMLTLGSTPKPFVPRNTSSLIADVKLGAIGNSKDILFKRDDRWLLRKAVEKDVVLDGSLAWVSRENNVGYKRISTDNYKPSLSKNDSAYVSKYDGKMLSLISGSAVPFATDQVKFSTSYADQLYFTISNTDSGWADAFTPTASDIKRYFNGWKYVDGTTWNSITGNGQTAIAQVALDTKPTDYTPYRLSYVLATPQTVDVTDKVEGQLKLNGLTQVSVDSGYRRTVVDGKSTWTKGSTFDYTANPTAVKLTYANNIRNALDDTTRTVQDNTSMLSVHEKAIVDLYVRVKALEAK